MCSEGECGVSVTVQKVGLDLGYESRDLLDSSKHD